MSSTTSSSSFGVLGRIIYALYPILTFISTAGYSCRAQPFAWEPPKWLFNGLWVLVTLLASVAAVFIYNLNNESVTTFFFGLMWMLGSGWIFAVRMCPKLGYWSYLLYSLFILGFLLLLYYNCNQHKESDDANMTKNFLYPLFGWTAALILLYAYGVLATYVPRLQIQVDETIVGAVDPVICAQCNVKHLSNADLLKK